MAAADPKKKKKKRKKKESLEHKRNRILVALGVFAVVYALDELGALTIAFGEPGNIYASFALFLVPFLIAGYDVLQKAFNNIRRGKAFDESFLMAVATIGAFAMVLFPDTDPHMAEGAAVMLFYQVGELFQAYAVGKSRKSISAMMDIAPDYANVEQADGTLEQVFPDDIAVGTVIVVKPGERVPIDGVIVEGETQLDTAALTGESVPRPAKTGDDIISGCINMTGLIHVRTTKPFGESTVARVLELVENASEKKARTENFITRFARVYTPAVCYSALALAILPPVINLLMGNAASWGVWVYRALTFLVISCPCALVISIPLSFFAGLGGASHEGILIKGSNYLEALSKTKIVVFDKTGTLTQGVFEVTGVHHSPMEDRKLLEYAALAECASSHPISRSLQKACGVELDRSRVTDIEERGGRGVVATVDGHSVAAGNGKLMDELGVKWQDCHSVGTIVHMAVDGEYAGHIVISDVVKNDARDAIAALKRAGVQKTVMLTGDIKKVADHVAQELGVDEVHAELLPGDKVARLERLLGEKGKDDCLAFVGDGINDAPVLSRADIGIAMGAMGSDAAIEAADVVLMDDDPMKIAKGIQISRKCIRIVYENIVFSLGVKLTCLLLVAIGIANMWMGIFADVGVMVLAVLNAIRALRTSKN